MITGISGEHALALQDALHSNLPVKVVCTPPRGHAFQQTQITLHQFPFAVFSGSRAAAFSSSLSTKYLRNNKCVCRSVHAIVARRCPVPVLLYLSQTLQTGINPRQDF